MTIAPQSGEDARGGRLPFLIFVGPSGARTYRLNGEETP